MRVMNNYLTASVLGDVFGWILAAVIVVFLVGLILVLARRDARRRAPKSAGIQKAAVMNTQQTFELNTGELDLDELCNQPRVRAVMDDSERAILKAYAGGETESELAGRLVITRAQAEMQISELFARLEVNNRAELLKKLQEMLREEE